MIAGCTVLIAILFSILVLAARAFPDFVRRVRIGLNLAKSHTSDGARPVEFRTGRVIELPLSRISIR